MVRLSERLEAWPVPPAVGSISATMNSPPQPLSFLLAFYAGWVNRHQQRVVEYLVVENKILKRQIGKRRVRLTDGERRRLARLGKALGRKLLTKIATIVTPDTILSWHRKLVAAEWTYPRKGPGRPSVMKEIRALIVRLAIENPDWGYRKIRGALSNLGHKVARSTIAKTLKENGIPPAPERPSTWRTFMKSHWETLAAADFFQIEVWTTRGLRTFFVLFAIRIATRRVEILGITDAANDDFMRQVARNITDIHRTKVFDGVTHLIIDNDTRFAEHFRTTLRDAGIECVRIPPRAPNCSPHAERWVRSIKSECLSKMIFFGVGSLRRAVTSYLDHYHRRRNHQGRENTIIDPGPEVGRTVGKIERCDDIGGLLRYYHRAAA